MDQTKRFQHCSTHKTHLNPHRMEKREIAVIVGSLRKASFNLKTAKALQKLAGEGYTLHILDISQLPFFNEDLENEPPEAWVTFRQALAKADAFLFVTPEYNRSVPAVLKNAIDVGSRPYGKNAWDGKPGAVISVSIGQLCGFGANHHLRQSLVFVNVRTMAQPEAYLGNASTLFNEEGELTDERTEKFLKKFMSAFEAWIQMR